MNKGQAGFTLLEVMVALAVLAIAMGAIIGIATQSVNTVGQLRDQTFAGWVALNKINELMLSPDSWPNEGGRQGSVELANHTWRWEAKFQKTDDADLARLDMTIRRGDANGPALTTLTAFKSRPLVEQPDAANPTEQPPVGQEAASQNPSTNPSTSAPQ